MIIMESKSDEERAGWDSIDILEGWREKEVSREER